MTDPTRVRHLAAQAVAAVHVADDEEFLLRCTVLACHDLREVREALVALREEPMLVETIGDGPASPTIMRTLEPGRVAATHRYLECGELGDAEELERIVDAVLLLADEAAGREQSES